MSCRDLVSRKCFLHLDTHTNWWTIVSSVSNKHPDADTRAYSDVDEHSVCHSIDDTDSLAHVVGDDHGYGNRLPDIRQGIPEGAGSEHDSLCWGRYSCYVDVDRWL